MRSPPPLSEGGETMKGGFSFCGVDIASLGIEYAPELEDTYVYKPAEAEVHEETFDGHHGGYFYGATIKPKEFNLRVFFEENIDRGLMAKVYNLFKIGRTGRLVFQRRPWCYYNATVTAVDDSNLLSYLSGTIKITMKCAYPFGRSDMNSARDLVVLRTDNDYFKAIENTAFLEKIETVPPVEFESLTEPKDIVLVNPGTRRSPVCIVVSGDVGEGVEITNRTTGQSCLIIGLTKDITTNAGKSLYVDGMNGKVVLSGNNKSEAAFLYHDKGFIELESSFPAIRHIFVNHGRYSVSTIIKFEDNVEGKHMFIDNRWVKILKQTDTNHMTIDTSVSEGTSNTIILGMNEVHIEPLSTMDISLKFIYKPTFA